MEPGCRLRRRRVGKVAATGALRLHGSVAATSGFIAVGTTLRRSEAIAALAADGRYRAWSSIAKPRSARVVHRVDSRDATMTPPAQDGLNDMEGR